MARKGDKTMGKQIRWLWENMDKPYQKRHIIALCVCVITCALLLVNPALSRRLIDEVIVAQNPDPLMDILMLMLAVKLGREGMRYLMVIFLEKASQSPFCTSKHALFGGQPHKQPSFCPSCDITQNFLLAFLLFF